MKLLQKAKSFNLAEFRKAIFPEREEREVELKIEKPNFEVCHVGRAILINIFDSCVKVAGRKEGVDRKNGISLVEPLRKDEGVINYVLDSEEEFEDKFGDNVSQSGGSDSEDMDGRRGDEVDSFIIDDEEKLSEMEGEEEKVERVSMGRMHKLMKRAIDS